MNQYSQQFEADTKQLFSGWAGRYDSSLFLLYFERLYCRILEILAQHGRDYISPGATVLDIACGTGEVLFRLATQHPKTSFIGIDLTVAMVEAAREKTKLLPNVEIKEGNAERLSFSDQAFDAVLCSEAFHHFSNPKQALEDMHRVAKDRSLLLLVDPGFSVLSISHYFFNNFFVCTKIRRR